MSWSDDYFKLVEEELKKKKKKEELTPTETFETSPYSAMGRLAAKASPKSPLGKAAEWKETKKDLPEPKKDEEKERTVFTKGAFEDGYQFGDILRTAEGTVMDIRENAITGVLGIGEGLLNFGGTLVGGVGKLFGADEFADDAADYVARDKINEEKIAKAIVNGTSGVFRITAGDDADDISVLGEKADSFVQSGGQLLGAAATGPLATAVIGATAFGDEAANAFQNDATYGEAVLSATITAGAEMLTEKISGGIKFGGKALDEAATKWLSRNITNKAVRLGMQMGMDFLGEGSEEVLSGVLSALGQKLTYADDKELNELFSSEEALESFVSGGLLGFGSSGIKAGISASQGKDAVSGLTKNEESVVKKIYDDTVKEAEKNGKVSEKDKAKIYDDIVEQMSKGQIDTDIIEEVLGGDNYKAYKRFSDNNENLKKQQKAWQDEFNSLNKLKQGDMTGEQIDRREELRQKLQDIQARIDDPNSKGQRDYLKAQLSKNVYEMTKGDRLVESYFENVRRNQKFEADLSKYEGKAKEVIKQVMDSGLADNSRATHEFWDMAAKIAENRDTNVSIADQAQIIEMLKKEHEAKGKTFDASQFDGKIIDGFISDNGIVLNAESKRARSFVIGHEITHSLEKSKHYDQLQKLLFNYNQAEYQSRFDARKAQYKGIYSDEAYKAKIDKEVTADMVGDFVFSDYDFVKHLATQNQNVFQKIWNEIKYLAKIATAGSKEARELEKVKREFERAWNETKAQKTGKTDATEKIGSNAKFSLENNGKSKYNKRSRYSETETLFLRWENGSAPAGEVKKFARFGKTRYYLKTENGSVELSKQQYIERNKEYAENTYGRAEREAREAFDHDEFAQRGLLGDHNRHRNTGGNAAVFGQTIREELPNVAGRSESSTLRNDRGNASINQSGYSDEASDDSGASSFITFSNDYATIRNFMKDGDVSDTDGVKITEDGHPATKDAGGEIQFSLSNDAAYMDKAIEKNNSMLHVDSKRMEEAKGIRNRIAERMNAIKDRGLVGLPEDIEGNTYIANSSYDGTEENTTICPRSLASEAFTDAVSEYLGRPLSVEEQIYISQDLQGRSLTPECTYCYVATDRKAYRAFLGEYINQRDAVLKKVQAGPNADVSRSGELYKEFLNGRKDTEPMYKRFKMWVDAYKNGTPMVDASHLANINKLMGDINSEFGEALKPQITDAMKYAQSASWAKKRINYVAYNGHILNWKQDRINKLNSHYGLRMYSFSDFHPAFVLENMQMITDASVRGLKMLGYTKDTDFVEIFAPSGMNINVSTFGFEAGGNVYENNIIGAEWEKAKALREQYPNVGVTFVATNDTLVDWALEQDWIDVVIPYHLVRTGTEVAKAFGYTNYTSESADTKTKEWTKVDKKSIAPTEHNNDLETYFKALEKNHLNPRFERFKDRPNYMKLVNECRQSASESKPVQPVFNEDAAMKALAKLEANGYYQPIGGSVERMYEIAAEVAENMNQELAPAMSISDAGQTFKTGKGWNAPMSDMRYVPEDIAPVSEEVNTKVNTEVKNASVEDLFPDNYAPTAEEEEAWQAERMDSLMSEDAPPEVDAPYYGESKPASVDDPFEGRDWYDIGNRKVKAYMYENPEVKPFFQMEAMNLLTELKDTTKAERWYNDELYYESGGEAGFGGVNRHTSDSIAELLDSWHMSYADIEKGLNAIIEDNGAENIAAAKKLEFMLNDRLLHGYKDFYSNGRVPPSQEYINLLNEKQITEYSTEAFDALMTEADRIAPVGAVDTKPTETVNTSSMKGVVQGQQTFITTEDKLNRRHKPMGTAEVDPGEYAPVAEKYEAIKPKRTPSKEPRMARADSKGEERRWYKTSTGSDAVDGKVTPDDIPDELRYYQPIPNKKTLGNANSYLAQKGYDKALAHFNEQIESKKVSLDDIALGERLIQEAIKKGDTKTASELIQNVAILGTELGQKVQALSIIKKLTPEGQLMMLQKTVDRGKTKGDKAFEGVELTQEMKDKILSAYKPDGSFDQMYLTQMVEDVKQQIADQMKVTAWDKINAWRYLSMLGNPKTHIRNVVSNVAMLGTRQVKNAIARTIEDIAPIEGRTKTWKQATDAVKAFSDRMLKEMDSDISGDKYSDSGSIKAKRKIFDTKAIEWASTKNSELLQMEDAKFSKPAFKSALSEFLTANGIKTEADIKKNPELVAKAKQYAMEQAKEATFQQDSYLANKIGEIERKNPGYGMLIGSVLPFKKTPINIAKAGLNYSPLGIARNIYDMVQVKKGNMDASEAIDHVAQTLTGSSLTLVGFMLAQAGILNGAGDDDKEGEYDYQLGKQAYSLNFFGDTFSLSWLSPVAMPLFVGANAYEQLVEGKEWNADVVVETLAQTLDPLSEMSFLSSLDSVLSSYDSGIQKFMGIFETAGQNYITQFVPTLSSQIAATFDDTKRSTKVAADSDFKFGDRLLNQIKYKIPGLRNTLEPSTDIWGNENKQTEIGPLRAFESFLAPWSKRENITSAVDEEIKDLYSQVGDGSVIPGIPSNTINYDGVKYEMSAKEHTAFKQAYGQLAYDTLEDLFNTDTYRNADAETRRDMVKMVYDYARDEARRMFFDGRDVDFTNATEDGEEVYKENAIVGAIKADLPVAEYKFSEEYPEKYKFFKDNGLYENYAAADEEGKRAYSWAYENPGKYTMSKAVADDFLTFYRYRGELFDLEGDKDENGKTISGSKKEKVIAYINDMDLDYGQKIILFRSMYSSKEDRNNYNADILEYLNSREDLSFEERVTILKELGFNVNGDQVTWD